VYGTAIEGLKPSVESNRIAVNDIDVQGVDEYKAMSPNVHAVFLLPPSIDEWNKRRLARYGGGIDAEDNRVRLESAKMELEFALSKGYFDFLVNNDVTQAAEEIKHIVAGTKDIAAHKEAEALAHSLYEELSTH